MKKTIKFNKIYIFLIFISIFPSCMFAFIYDDMVNINNFDGFKISGNLNFSEFLVNGKKVNMKNFLTDSHQGDVIGYYQNYAKEKKLKIIDNKNIKMLAFLLLNNREEFFNPDFDYLFYIDKNKTGNLVAASTNSDRTNVVIMKIPANIDEKINIKKIKKLKLPDELTEILYVNFPGLKSKYNFFYHGVFDTREFDFASEKWLKNLKNEKWQITKLNNDNKSDYKFLFIKKDNDEYFVFFSIIKDKLYFSIIG